MHYRCMRACRPRLIRGAPPLAANTFLPQVLLPVPIPISARLRTSMPTYMIIFIRAPFREWHAIHFHFACHSQREYPLGKLVNVTNRAAPAGNPGHRSSFIVRCRLRRRHRNAPRETESPEALVPRGFCNRIVAPRLMPSLRVLYPPSPGPFPRGTVRSRGEHGQWER